MEKYLLGLLDDLARITFEIKKVYDKITYLIINKDYLSDYDAQLTKCLEKLALLKVEEEDDYSYIDNNINYIVEAINYLSKHENDNMDEDARLSFMRIKNNLHILMYLLSPEELSIGIKAFKNDTRFKFLLANGVGEEDALEHTAKFKYHFEKSISYRYITSINDRISKTNNDKNRSDYIKIKTDTSFVYGNEVEEELITSKFTVVPNRLDQELVINSNVGYRIKREYQNLEALLSIFNNLGVLSTLSPGIDATRLIVEFEVFILYLDKKDLNAVKENILLNDFNSMVIKIILINAIDNIKELKKLHNGDINSKTL